jgi:hypothetical protein
MKTITKLEDDFTLDNLEIINRPRVKVKKPISMFEIGETQFLIIEMMTLLSGILIGFLFRGP